METSDREPKYLGTHRGVARVQIGWTTLYFRGDAYTHALGSLYGTQESPTREEIAAARKVIPISPKPPVMANAPGAADAASRKRKSTPREKPGAARNENRSKPTAKPTRSAETPRRAGHAPPGARGPSKAKDGTAAPKRDATKPKAKAERKGSRKAAERKPTGAPIAKMADLVAKVEAPARQGSARSAKAIGSMAELAAQLS